MLRKETKLEELIKAYEHITLTGQMKDKGARTSVDDFWNRFQTIFAVVLCASFGSVCGLS